MVLGSRAQVPYVPTCSKTDWQLGDYILAVPMKAFSGHDGGERNVGSHHLADGELSR